MECLKYRLPQMNRIVTLVDKTSTFIWNNYQSGETDFITSVLIDTLLFCEVNSHLFFCLKTGELQ